MPVIFRELGMEEDVIEEEMSKERLITRDNFKILVIESMFR
jgi:hypothetical protein